VNKRLYNLDYLRGLAALGIMLYHYLSWTFPRGTFTSQTFIGRVGVYGVSMFYVLSGLTLFYVYFNKMSPSKIDVIDFMKKRFFRIFPLLWIATITAIVLEGPVPDIITLILNLTGLFGIIRWNAAIATGAWSIGNELTFYLFFPFFILFIKKSKILFIILSILIFMIYLYYAFIVLDKNISLDEQWHNYTNPLNQLFLFLGGFLIGLLFRNVKIKFTPNMLILICGASLFIFFPVNGDEVQLVTGVNRLIFTLSCFFICFSFYKLKFQLLLFFHKPFILLGEASYSVYLLHPLVYKFIGNISSFAATYHFHVREYIRFPLSVISTLIISYWVYEFYEKYFMQIGKRKIAGY
jgi:exopolysaccharide production protein ExoZ